MQPACRLSPRHAVAKLLVDEIEDKDDLLHQFHRRLAARHLPHIDAAAHQEQRDGAAQTVIILGILP